MMYSRLVLTSYILLIASTLAFGQSRDTAIYRDLSGTFTINGTAISASSTTATFNTYGSAFLNTDNGSISYDPPAEIPKAIRFSINYQINGTTDALDVYVFDQSIECQVSLELQYGTRSLSAGFVGFINAESRGINALLASDIQGMMSDNVWSNAACWASQNKVSKTAYFPFVNNNSPAGGSVVQSEAVPTSQTTPVANGSLAASGTDAGANALTTIAINPAIFFVNPEDKKEWAKWTRLLDMSAVVPVNNLDMNQDGQIDYIGFRMHINGVKQTSTVYDQLDDKFGQYLQSASKDIDNIEAVIAQASNCEDCIKALFFYANGTNCDPAAIEENCGEALNLPSVTDDLPDVKKWTEKARKDADKKYFGAELKFDYGDPTLGAVPNAFARSLFAGMAIGRAIGKEENGRLQGRLGINYKALELDDFVTYDIEGALGVKTVKASGFEQIQISTGLEWRYSMDSQEDSAMPLNFDETLQTNYLYFRFAVNVPFTPSNSVSLLYGTSLYGDKSNELSLNINWGVLNFN